MIIFIYHISEKCTDVVGAAATCLGLYYRDLIALETLLFCDFYSPRSRRGQKRGSFDALIVEKYLKHK